MLKRSLLILSVLVFSSNAFGQGTVGTLRCAFSPNTTFEVNATRDPASKVVGKVKCGDRIMAIDQRFGSPHIRTEDGLDGYILGLSIGQWTIELPPITSQLPGLPEVDAPQRKTKLPSRPKQEFRRFEAGLSVPTYIRQGGGNLLGASASFAVNVTPGIAVTSDVNVERIIEPLTDNIRAVVAHVGLRANVIQGRSVTVFIKSTPGFWHAFDNNADKLSGFSFRAGGGVDYNANQWLRWRVIEGNYSLLALDETWSNGIRLGTGLAVRLGGAEER